MRRSAGRTRARRAAGRRAPRRRAPRRQPGSRRRAARPPRPPRCAPRTTRHACTRVERIGRLVDGDPPVVAGAPVHAVRAAPSRDRAVPIDASITCSAVTAAATSIIGISTSCPSPVRSRCSSAATSASAVCVPTIGSTTPPGMIGGPSSYPVCQAIPVICSIVWANPPRSRHGPSRPNAGSRSITTDGLIARTSSYARPNPSITDGVKFSVTTSAVAISRFASASPSGMAEIERDPALAEVGRVPQRRHLVEARLDLRADRRAEPQAVGPLHRLDLDDVGAHRAQPRGRERPRPERGEVDHPEPGERPRPDADLSAADFAVVVALSVTLEPPMSAPKCEARAQLAVGDGGEAERRPRAGSTTPPAGSRTSPVPSAARTRGAARRCRRPRPAPAPRCTPRPPPRPCAPS